MSFSPRTSPTEIDDALNAPKRETRLKEDMTRSDTILPATVPPSKSPAEIDDALNLLEDATQMEEEMTCSATILPAAAVAAKYFEACSRLDKAAANISTEGNAESQKILVLLNEKSSHYKIHARSILQSCSVTNVSLLDAKLSHAIDLDEQGNADEAIESYLSVAEEYLQGLKRVGEEEHVEIMEKIKGRLKGVLNRVEVLKARRSA